MLWELVSLILLPLMKDAAPEVRRLFVAWLKKHRVAIESEIPELYEEIDEVAKSGDLERLSDLDVRLFERVAARQAGQPDPQARQ